MVMTEGGNMVDEEAEEVLTVPGVLNLLKKDMFAVLGGSRQGR